MLTIDTIKIQSPPLDEIDLIKLQHQFIKKNTIVSQNDELQKETVFYVGELAGSFDHRLGLTFNDDSLVVEGSLHKYMFNGQNIVGGTLDVHLCVNIINDINNTFGTSIDVDLSHWGVYRLDLSVNVFYNNDVPIDSVLFLLKNSYYPRRKLTKYPTSIDITGTTTHLKCYSKNPEFCDHDFGKIRKHDALFADYLALLSNRVLRWEVEFRRPYMINNQSPLISSRLVPAPAEYQDFDTYTPATKLITKNYTARSLYENYIHKVSLNYYDADKMDAFKKTPAYYQKGLPCIDHFFDKQLLLNMFNKEFSKFIMAREQKEYVMLNTMVEVSKALMDFYPNSYSTYLGTYTLISTLGFDEARKNAIKNDCLRKFQRHVAIFKKLNISLVESDINVVALDTDNKLIINPTNLIDMPDLVDVSPDSDSIKLFMEGVG